MINEKIDKTLDFIDLDPKFLFSILKKYFLHITIFVTLISTLVYLGSLNLDKKYKSSAKIVIEPDEKNIVMNNIINSIKKLNISVLFIEHDMEIVEKFSNRVVAFYNGEILADGDPQTVLKQKDVIKYIVGSQNA